MGPKKGKDAKGGKGAKGAKDAKGKGGKEEPPRPKKIPPPPACFTPQDIARYKEVYKEHDEDNIDLVPIGHIPVMLRKLGFNPKPAEIKDLFERFLEDDLVDQVMFHEFLQMIEAKIIFGDDIELVVTKAMMILGHDDEETGLCDLETLHNELMKWGDPIEEIEWVDWLKFSIKDKIVDMETGQFNYVKFIENINNRDQRFFKEPINFFKLDQKTLAAMAVQKAQEEKEAEEKQEAERQAKAAAKRAKMIAEGLIPPD